MVDIQFQGAQDIVDRWTNEVNLMEESADTYIPVEFMKTLGDNRQYKPYFSTMWGEYYPQLDFYSSQSNYMSDEHFYDCLLQKLGSYDSLYVHYLPWTGAYDCIVLKDGLVLHIKPYLKSDNSNECFSSSSAWRKEMDERFRTLLNEEGDGEILFRLKEMEKIEKPQWRFDIKERAISSNVYHELIHLMNLFKKSNLTKTKYKPWLYPPKKALYFFERYFICLGEADYRYYGADSQLFGMSLLGGARFASQKGWADKMEFLFSRLKSYALDEGSNQSHIKSLCDEMLGESIVEEVAE